MAQSDCANVYLNKNSNHFWRAPIFWVALFLSVEWNTVSTNSTVGVPFFSAKKGVAVKNCRKVEPRKISPLHAYWLWLTRRGHMVYRDEYLFEPAFTNTHYRMEKKMDDGEQNNSPKIRLVHSDELEDVLEDNDGKEQLDEAEIASKARKALEATKQVDELAIEREKAFEMIAGAKELLEICNTEDEEKRVVYGELILPFVQKTCLKHGFFNSNGSRDNAGAAKRIMKCLKQFRGNDTDEQEKLVQIVNCVACEVFTELIVADPQPEGEPVGEAEEVEEEVEETTEDPMVTYLDCIAESISDRVERIEVDGSPVMVLRPHWVTLSEGRDRDKNKKWFLYYNSVMGEENNQWMGSGEDSYQVPFRVEVADQELAACVNPEDDDAIADLIRDSVPRHRESGTPLNYFVMTRENRDMLQADIAELLGLEADNRLLGWLWFELCYGADCEKLKALLAQKQEEYEERKQLQREKLEREREARKKAESERPKEDLTALRPRPVKSDRDDEELSVETLQKFAVWLNNTYPDLLGTIDVEREGAEDRVVAIIDEAEAAGVI